MPILSQKPDGSTLLAWIGAKRTADFTKMSPVLKAWIEKAVNVKRDAIATSVGRLQEWM
jgi:hypothetical protein